MVGSFAPNAEPIVFKLEEDIVPGGFLSRGTYTSKIKLQGKAFQKKHYFRSCLYLFLTSFSFSFSFSRFHFVDDDKTVHADVQYKFKISKQWP
jgi:hypothetical protein